MRYSTFLSVLLHLGAFAGGFILAPFLRSEKVPYVPVVPIEILSEAEIAEELSVRADRTEDAVEEEEPEPQRTTAEDVPAEEPEPAPPEPELKEPEPEKTPEPEPERLEPKPEPEKPKPKKPEPEAEEIDDLSFLDDALVDLENDSEKSAPSEVLDPEGERNQEAVGLGDQLTATEIDLVRARMAECYDQPTGVPDAEKLVVRIRIILDRTGEIQGQPEVLNARQIALSNNSWWRATRDRAMRAVVACQPYDYLPQDRYYVWQEVTLNFTPLGVM